MVSSQHRTIQTARTLLRRGRAALFPQRASSRTAGFSIIEILVVISIIAILTTVGLVSYTQTNRRARDGKRKADLEQVRSALVLYRVDEGSYPLTLDWSTMSPIEEYITGTSVSDPLNSNPDYNYTSDGITFSVCATLEATTPSSYCVTNP